MPERRTEGTPSEADVRARIASLGFAWLAVAFVLVSVTGTVAALWPALTPETVILSLPGGGLLVGLVALALSAALVAGREWLRLRRR